MNGVQVSKDKSGEWRWQQTAANGQVVADSGEGYERRIDCIEGAVKALGGESYEFTSGMPGRLYGVIRRDAGDLRLEVLA
jgi:uncharacterized protein YegP (UPF0339 family)